MRRPIAILALLGALGTLAAASLAPPAAAVHSGKNCGIVSKGSRDYRARAQQMDCKPARKGVLLYLRRHEARRGFTCTPAAGRTPFYCKNGNKVYWAIRL